MRRAFFLGVLWFIPISLGAQTIVRSVVSSGATIAQGESILLRGTIGQHLIGSNTTVFTQLGHGFWYQAQQGALTVESSSIAQVRITPQPAVTSATVEIECQLEPQAQVLTLQGRELVKVEFTERAIGTYIATIDCRELASGVYMIEFRCGSRQTIVPLMITK